MNRSCRLVSPFFVLSFLLAPFLLPAQNVGINQTGTNPDPSAMLDVVASDMGILIPRVQLDDASTQAPIAAAPQEGLLIYNENGSEPNGFYYWDGGQWVSIDAGGTGYNTSLVLNGNSLELTDGGGTLTEDLSSLIDDADADPSNELITNMTLNGSILEVTEAGTMHTADLSSLGGGGHWDRNATDGFLFPSNPGDSVHIGHNDNGGKLDVRQTLDINTSAVYGLADQATDSWDYHRVGVMGEANGFNGFGISYGILGMTDPSQGFISNAVVARLGSSPPSGWGSWSGNSALYADANGMGKAGHFTGGAVTVQFNTPQALFHVANGSEVGLESNNTAETGYIMAGRNSSTNIRMDDDEILAQDGGAISDLHLQEPGGALRVHDGMGELSWFIVHEDGDVGIGIDTNARDLNIQQGTTNSSTAGILLSHNSSGDDWSMYHANTDNLWFMYNDALASWIDPAGNYNTSDRRLKEDIDPLTGVLERVMKLEPSSYHHVHSDSGERQIGMIAQDLEPHFPQLVDHEEEEDVYGVNYGAMSVVAIKAVQEQQAVIREQEKELEGVKEKNQALEDRLQELERTIQGMKTE